MPMPRRIDAILKRERTLELLSKRDDRVIGGLGRQLGQQNKVIQVNAITQGMNSQLNVISCDIWGCLEGSRSKLWISGVPNWPKPIDILLTQSSSIIAFWCVYYRSGK